MKNRVNFITIMVLATFIMIVSVAGCNTSCNKKPTASLVPTETETFVGIVVETSEINGSKVAIIETEIDGVKVTETSVVTSDTDVKVGESVVVTTTTNGTTVVDTNNGTTSSDTTTVNNTSGTTSGTTTIPTNGNPTADPTTTTTTAAPTTSATTTQTTVATPTPKPNNTSGDINFGNDESAASSYGDQHNTPVETTAAPTNTPVPTATPKPTATPTPEPTATPTPEPTATPTPEPEPTKPEPQTEYKTVTVNWEATDWDNNSYSGTISGVGVHRDPGSSWKYDNKSNVDAQVRSAIGNAIPGGFDECAGYSFNF